MDAYLIDPAAFAITPIDINPHNILSDLYTYIGCSTVDATSMDNGDTLYVDDEGLLKPQVHFIIVDGYPQPLAGKAVLLGSTPNGNSTNPSIALGALTARLTFMERLIGPVVSLRKAARPSIYRLAKLTAVLSRLEEHGTL